MNKEIIVVKQLPVIVEQLQTIKADVTERVAEAMSLVCTEDTVKEVKKSRAELNKEFQYWEEQRKAVKKAVMQPYEDFEAIYKECITDVFKNADKDLKTKVNDVEDGLKEQKEKEVREYFTEYLASKDIDFVTFEQSGINVTLSASLKSLKTQAQTFVDRICENLKLIDIQEHKEEVLYEYKKTFNVTDAIATVVNRYKAIEEAKAKEEERKAQQQAKEDAAKKVDSAVETLTPPTIEPPTVEEPILTVKFTVRGTKEKLKQLKEFLTTNNYDFE